jgi:hypothetical protein
VNPNSKTEFYWTTYTGNDVALSTVRTIWTNARKLSSHIADVLALMNDNQDLVVESWVERWQLKPPVSRNGRLQIAVVAADPGLDLSATDLVTAGISPPITVTDMIEDCFTAAGNTRPLELEVFPRFPAGHQTVFTNNAGAEVFTTMSPGLNSDDVVVCDLTRFVQEYLRQEIYQDEDSTPDWEIYVLPLGYNNGGADFGGNCYYPFSREVSYHPRERNNSQRLMLKKPRRNNRRRKRA